MDGLNIFVTGLYRLSIFNILLNVIAILKCSFIMSVYIVSSVRVGFISLACIEILYLLHVVFD